MIIEYNAIVYSIKRGIVSPEQLENSSSKKLKKKRKKWERQNEEDVEERRVVGKDVEEKRE